MEAICPPKRRYELVLHGTESQEASIIDTIVKASHKTVFFGHKLYPSMERMINSDSTVAQVWNPIITKNLEDGGDTFSEASVRTRATGYKVTEGIYNEELVFLLSILQPGL
jgi:hypothetical protein